MFSPNEENLFLIREAQVPSSWPQRQIVVKEGKNENKTLKFGTMFLQKNTDLRVKTTNLCMLAWRDGKESSDSSLYLGGCWVQLRWLSCPLRSGSGQMADIAPPCRPPLPGCETDPWAARGSLHGTLCGWWCQTRKEPLRSGPWPGSTYEQDWC